MAKSKQYLEQAIEMDQNYALAWCGLAEYYWWLGFLGFMPPKETNVECKRAATRALELDETLAEAHSLMAMLLSSEYDWKDAEREFLRALDLNPDSPDVLVNYSQFFLTPKRRLDEAVSAARNALELDPLSPHLQFRIGYPYFLMNKYDRAIEQFRNALELDPNYYWAHTFVGVTYIMIGKPGEGIHSLWLILLAIIPISVHFAPTPATEPSWAK